MKKNHRIAAVTSALLQEVVAGLRVKINKSCFFEGLIGKTGTVVGVIDRQTGGLCRVHIDGFAEDDTFALYHTSVDIED